MRVKGGTQQPRGASTYPNYDLMHFVVLRPAGDGTWRTTATSVDQRMPVISDPDAISTYTSGVAPLCVQPGDRIGLASVGGFDPQLFPAGLPYQVFGAVQGALAQEFRAGGAIAENRTVVRGDRVPDAELLMQVVIGTGPDARPTCGGTAPSGSDPGLSPGPSGPPPPAAATPGSVRIPKPARDPRMFDGKVRLTLRCAARPRLRRRPLAARARQADRAPGVHPRRRRDRRRLGQAVAQGPPDGAPRRAPPRQREGRDHGRRDDHADGPGQGVTVTGWRTTAQNW